MLSLMPVGTTFPCLFLCLFVRFVIALTDEDDIGGDNEIADDDDIAYDNDEDDDNDDVHDE